MNIYVLIIVSTVWSGNVFDGYRTVTSVEKFSTKAACEAVKKEVIDKSRDVKCYCQETKD